MAIRVRCSAPISLGLLADATSCPVAIGTIAVLMATAYGFFGLVAEEEEEEEEGTGRGG